MASSPEFVEYVCDQLAGAGQVHYKRMFGEYGVFCGGKMVGMVCDDQFFVKDLPAARAVCPGCALAPPYPGAKPHLLVECLDDRERMARLAAAVWQQLPFPAPRKGGAGAKKGRPGAPKKGAGPGGKAPQKDGPSGR